MTDLGAKKIVSDPKIMMGKPVIDGTRITVEQILRYLASGLNADQLAEELEGITAKDVYSAQAYAADYLAGERIIAAE